MSVLKIWTFIETDTPEESYEKIKDAVIKVAGDEVKYFKSKKAAYVPKGKNDIADTEDKE
jgi:hypothetical protein